ncbi:MAG: hypothetical protein ACRDG7_00845 [Candidatus Limnocylindria bacterium]
MTRTVFVIGAVAWLLVGIGMMGVAVLGSEWLLARLPPLAIDADALGGALTAMAVAMLTVGATHIVLLIGLARGSRWARSAGALVASVLAAILLGLAAAATSSALRDAANALPLIGAAVLAAVGVLAYLLVAVRLARELGSGSAV